MPVIHAAVIQDRAEEHAAVIVTGDKMQAGVGITATTVKKPEPVSSRHFFILLACLAMLAFLSNFLGGLLPAVLTHLMNDFELSLDDAGLVGAMRYLGFGGAAPFIGYFLSYRSTRQIRWYVCIAESFSCLCMFAIAAAPPKTKWLLISARGIGGVSEVFLFIFAPLWIDQNAPAKKQKTLCIGLFQVASILGAVIGYILGAAAGSSWRVVVYAQGSLGLGVAILVSVPALFPSLMWGMSP